MGGYWSSKKDPEEKSEKNKKKRKRGAELEGHQGKKLLVANPYVLTRTGYASGRLLERCSSPLPSDMPLLLPVFISSE